jgi:hypothetical protein
LKPIEQVVKAILDAVRSTQEGAPSPADFTTLDKFYEAVVSDKTIKPDANARNFMWTAMERFGCFKMIDPAKRRWMQVDMSEGATGSARAYLAPICIANRKHWEKEIEADIKRTGKGQKLVPGEVRDGFSIRCGMGCRT